jgi:hypothetical protein
MLIDLFKSKKIFVILVAIFTIINVVIAVIIFADIEIISAPKTDVFINVAEVGAESILIEASIKMTNSNNFEISLTEMEIVSTTKDDTNIGNITIEGGNIPADSTREFTVNETINFKGDDFSELKSEITGKIAVTFLGFIKKTIPIEITVHTSIDELIENFQAPTLTVNADFDTLTNEGLNFTATIEVYNPNDLEFGIDQLSVIAKTENSTEVGRLSIMGDAIKPKESATFQSTGSIMFDALDANILIFTIEGIARGKVGGIEKSISFKTDTKVVIPDIIDFIFKNEKIDFQIPVQFKLRLNGIHSTVGFKIYNPSEIPLVGKDLICSIFRLDGEKMTLLAQKNMETCSIAPKNRVCVKTEMTIPYLKFFISGSFKILPDWIILRIDGNFSIAGTRQAFPISLNAYVDPHLIKNSNTDL